MSAEQIMRGMSKELLASKIAHYRELLEREKEGSSKIRLPHMVPHWTSGLSMMLDVFKEKNGGKEQMTIF